jgi:hypothetical protein
MAGRLQLGQSFYSAGMRITQKLVLHEDSSFELHYGPRSAPEQTQHDCGQDRHRGCSATVGIEAPSSSVYHLVQCGTGAGPMPGYVPLDNGTLIRFAPI